MEITVMGLQCVHTDTIPIIHTPAHHTGTTVRSGLTAEFLSAPVRGITGVGAMIDIWVVVEIGVMGATGARDGGIIMLEVTDAAMPVTMLAADTDTVTQVADPMAVEQSAAADFTVGAQVASIIVAGDFTVGAAVASVAAVGSTVEAEVAFTAVAEMAADAGKQLYA